MSDREIVASFEAEVDPSLPPDRVIVGRRETFLLELRDVLGVRAGSPTVVTVTINLAQPPKGKVR